MSDVTTTETVEVVVHVDRTLSDRRALTLIVSPDNVEIIVHPDVPVGTVDCLREELADAVANAVCAWLQSEWLVVAAMIDHMTINHLEPLNLMERPRWRRRCTATSKQSGGRCRCWALPWQSVCRIHGGMAPQNLAKANERRSATLAYLLGFTPGLIERMQQILTDPEAKDRDVIAVAKLILDVLIPVGYQPRSQYAFTDDEIAEIEDLPDVAADIEDLPDVVA